MPNTSVTRRLALFSITSLAAVGAGFFLPRPWLSPAFHYTGYYFMFFLSLLWAAQIIEIIKQGFAARMKKHGAALLLAVALTVLVFQISPPEFKILADETNLVSVSMAMHYNKTVSMPIQGLAIEYAPFDDYMQSINPRPLLYPFAVSVVHAIYGYNPYNGMVVNFLLGIAILFVMYLLFSLVFSRFFGFTAMIITASFPVFITWVTSSGFETINLFFMVIVLLGVFLFLDRKETKYGEFVFVSLLMLSNCRYESVLFIFPLLLLSSRFFNRQALSTYRLHVLFLPLFFLPLAWQRQIVFFNPLVRGDTGLMAPDQLFGITSFVHNLSRNLFALTGLNPDHGFIFPVFCAAVAGTYLAMRKRIHSSGSISPDVRPLIRYITVSGLMIFVFYTSFFWGQFTSDIDNRLAMAMLPFIVFPAIYFLYRLFRQPVRLPGFFLMLLLSAQIIYYWPVADAHRLLQRNALHYVNKRVTHCLYQQYDLDHEKLLLISDRPNLFVIHGIGAIGFKDAINRQKQLHYLENTYYDHILVLQRCSPITGAVAPDNQLNEGFQLKETRRINVSPDYYLRLSKVTCRRLPSS